MVKNTLLVTLPIMSTEWSVTFVYKVISFPQDWGKLGSVIHFTRGQNSNKYGERTPAVFETPNGFHLTSSLNGNGNYYFDYITDKTNHYYKIEIHQRYVSNGNYRYFIKIDGEEVHSAINNQAKQFYNVKVYAGNPWYNAGNGFISNFQFTNFL